MRERLGGRPVQNDRCALDVRPAPYPYRSLLAICSDLDETPDRFAYWEAARFLNTTSETAMGPGVGLEVGNTIYFDMPAGQFAYWNTDDLGREQVRALMRSGHIDCLHSFGDLATSRDHAARALDELTTHGCHLRVWIDHAVAPTNLGADIMRGQGDLPGAAAFHADLTYAYGVRYIWRGRVTSVIAQDAPHGLAGIFDRRHAASSAVTMAKEFAKRVAGTTVSRKYEMNAANRLLRPVVLRSGQRVQEFLRSDPAWAGLSRFDTADGLAAVLTPRFLEHLVERSGVCILYTHLGKAASAGVPFGAATRAALLRLADAERQGRILVTTTRRLLDYSFMRSRVTVTAPPATLRRPIDVSGTGVDGKPLGIEDIAGLTVYVENPGDVVMHVNGQPVSTIEVNPPDATGRSSVSVPWPRLTFPCL